MSEYIDKITDKDTGESRIISPAAEDVRVDNENFEGSDLDEVLNEIAEGLAEAGSGGYTPPEGGIPKEHLAPAVQQTLDDVAGKVDKVTGKGLSTNDYTDTDKAKVDNLKPVATSGSYNDLTDKPTIPTVPTMDSTPTAGNTTHMVSSDGVASAIANAGTVKTISVNGEQQPNNNGNVNITVEAGAQGPKGDTGNCTITGDGSNIVALIVNDLITGGAGNILSAEMGKRLKGKINEVYGVMQMMYAALADIAFTDGKSPAALPDLDWSLPKHALSLGISGNAVVYINGVQHGDGDVVQVEEYDTVSLVVAPAQGYALSAAPTVTVGGQSVTATPNGDGTYTAAIVMGTSNVVVTVSATTSSTHTITSVVKRITGLTTFNGNTAVQPTMTTAVDATTGTAVSNTGSVADGGNYSGVVTPGVGYGIFIVKVMMGSDDITDTAYNLVTREISIAQVTDDVTVTVTVREAENGLFLNTSYHARTDNGGGSSPFVPANAGLLVNDDEWCAMADFVAIPANANLLRWVFGSNTMQSADVTAPRPVWRRCVMYYDSDGIPVNFFTIGSTQHISAGYRDMTISGTLGVGAYIRASFKTSNLSSSKLQYSTDNGSTWNDLYVPQSVQSNNE